ncbi:DUF5681 domain-containing protein [Rhizobium sp. FKL33]|uniref:DUF5681 domain-containing protein n=1 Tax=Rhizobium sp. FKL33 TaxID=2562307 RepID=UPI0010C09FAB|nr:DUF5681 domain-containing protein [Rhizobium sp. FKL33]
MDEEAIKRQILFGEDSEPKRPANRGQFQKGQSGNPKGRPKKAIADHALFDQPMLSAALSLADSHVPVREGGETHSIPWREAIMRSIFTNAAKGNARSQTLAVHTIMRADAERARKRAEEIAFWRDYQQKTWAQIEAAKRKGLPPPTPLPHPDDIILDVQEGVRFKGPIDEVWQAKLEETIRYRDALIMQDALDQRSDSRLDGEPMRDPGAAGLCAHLLEKSIPPRLRLTDTEWLLRMMKYEGMPKRALMKELYGAWRGLGKDLPRGYVFPERTVMVENMEIIMSKVHEILAAEA